jgi:hypothetical protein
MLPGCRGSFRLSDDWTKVAQSQRHSFEYPRSEMLRLEAIGEVELEDNVLVIRRIHVILKLKAEASHRETATRVHGFFADRCPVYRAFKPAIAMTTELVFEALGL